MKTLFITGGNDGIGYYMIKQWLENGNHVSVLDLICDNLERLKEIYSRNLLYFKCDVCDKDSVKSAVNKTIEEFGEIHYAIHNACLSLFKSFEEHSREDFNKVLNVNFHGAIIMTEAVLPSMKAQRKGRICYKWCDFSYNASAADRYKILFTSLGS